MKKKPKRPESINSAPRGGKRGRKMLDVKEKAQDFADENPLPPIDCMALAVERFPEPGASRDAFYRDLVNLAEREGALRVECLAGSQVAARAANEVIRLRALIMGWIKTGPKPAAKPDAGSPQYADLPMFTDAEPQTDDVDVNAALEQSFKATDDGK